MSLQGLEQLNGQEQELFKKFIASIDVKPSNTKKVFAIGFIGVTGVGKSFIAQKLSEKLGLFVAVNDKIRRFLNVNGFPGQNPAQDIVMKLGVASGKYFYENKISYIMDADLVKHHDIAVANTQKYGAMLIIIRLTCPEEIILERLEKRSAEIAKDPASNLSRVGKEEYLKRKELHSSLPLPEIFFTIDTSQEVDHQVDNLITKLKKENYL